MSSGICGGLLKGATMSSLRGRYCKEDRPKVYLACNPCSYKPVEPREGEPSLPKSLYSTSYVPYSSHFGLLV